MAGRYRTRRTVKTLTATSNEDVQRALSPDEKELFMRESSMNPLAKNPKSTAAGIGQLLIANRIKYGAKAGVHPDTTDIHEQLKMARIYIDERYGDAEKALAFWDEKKRTEGQGWY